MKGLIQTPILIALIIASVLIISSYLYANYQPQFKPLDKYLKPQPEHGGLENITTPKAECYTSSDCKFDEFCSGQRCYKINCPSDYGYVKDHRCIPYECKFDSDCKFDEKCLDKKCVKIECSNGYIQNHVCINYECLSNSDCASNEYCSNRFCIELNCVKGKTPINHTCIQTTGLYTKAQTYITPFNPTVLAKLDELTNKEYTNEKFGKNFDRVYYYVSSIIYTYDKAKWGVEDYWQTAEQTINDGTGDCEDHAILLQSLLEALLYKTYGYIPNETVYMVCGGIDFDYDGTIDGGHCWNVIEASKLPKEWFTFSIFDTQNRTIPASRYVVLDDVTVNHTKRPEKTALYEPSKDLAKTLPLFQVYWQGRKWVELETTWQMPFSYYESRAYPYSYVWNAFNSIEYYEHPEFIKSGRRPTIFEDMAAYLYGFLKTVYNIIIRIFH
jgi:hypothetical protein